MHVRMYVSVYSLAGYYCKPGIYGNKLVSYYNPFNYEKPIEHKRFVFKLWVSFKIDRLIHVMRQ